MKIFILIGFLFLWTPYVYSTTNTGMNFFDLMRVPLPQLLDIYDNHENNAEAAAEFAGRYYLGLRGMPKVMSRAIEFYEEASEKGSMRALDRMGYFYENGIYVGQDVLQAAKVYEQAMDVALKKSNEELKYEYTLHTSLDRLVHLHETGKYSSDFLLNNGLALYLKVYKRGRSFSDRKRAKLYIEAQKKDKIALLKLSFQSGSHKGRDNGRERRFALIKAVEIGSAVAMVKLADAYKYGHDNAPQTEYTIKQAVALYKKAASKGSMDAAEALAEIYHYGIRDGIEAGTVIVNHNFLSARKFYKQAVELGSLKATGKMAEIYEKGLLDMRPNLEKALQYYVMILEREPLSYEKDGISIAELADLKEKSMDRLREMAKGGSADAHYYLGRFYRDGLRGVKSYQGVSANLALAVLFFEKAAKEGHEEAGKALREMVPENIRKVNSFACAKAFAF